MRARDCYRTANDWLSAMYYFWSSTLRIAWRGPQHALDSRHDATAWTLMATPDTSDYGWVVGLDRHDVDEPALPLLTGPVKDRRTKGA
jgi:hypothetical protein